MDFGLTDGYHVHDGLDQKSMCGYRLISHFVVRTSRVESQSELLSFLAAGAFVNNTIWVGSSWTTTQYILDIASDFFRPNNISINNDKTVAIPINCRVANPVLTVCGLLISIAKKGVPHCYLTHLDVRFFVNLVLRKAILDKQFAYLVFLVLFPIISYRTQFSFVPFSVYNKWDALICKDLKFKSGLLLDFPNDPLHHPFLYNLKTFEQIQAESKSASVIAFVNSVGVLSHLFVHRSHNFQVLSWHPHHPLLLLVHISVSSSNNFLAGVVCVFSGCNLSLGGSLASAFHLWGGTPMFLVLVSFLRCYGIAFVEQLHSWDSEIFDWKTFKHWKRLDPCGPVFSWFDLSVYFLGGAASSSVCSSHVEFCGSLDVHWSFGFGAVCNSLLNAGVTHLSVYMDGFLSNLGTIDMKAGAAVFFEDINLSLGVGVSGLVSSTLVELQAIALALECVPSFCVVDLFSNSQGALDAYKLESLLIEPDYKNHCWIKCYHIVNVIRHKNLDVNWIKIKDHSGISGNERADALARDAAFSAWCLPHLVNEKFIKTGIDAVSGNFRHFVHDVVPANLHADIDWLRSFLVWHPHSHLASSFTSTLYYQLPVVVQKCLYDRSYPNVVCLFCGDIEVLDHIFSCSFETVEVHSGLVWSSLCVSQLLSTCVADAVVGTVLCKGFVFSGWFCKSVLVFKDFKIVTLVIVNFMCAFCLSFRDDIWLVRAKHWAYMEKNGLILYDSSVPVSVFGSTLLFSPSVIRLLGIAEAFGVGFRFRKFCLFFSGIDDIVSIHIGA
ncbi:hypothetical protein G9A89_002603 [Geosiphon pyriformis]|nr:hypothetical protein G9A89_002603 [Geosiphon pyriformis]